jgi:hypothetical protein
MTTGSIQIKTMQLSPVEVLFMLPGRLPSARDLTRLSDMLTGAEQMRCFSSYLTVKKGELG